MSGVSELISRVVPPDSWGGITNYLHCDYRWKMYFNRILCDCNLLKRRKKKKKSWWETKTDSQEDSLLSIQVLWLCTGYQCRLQVRLWRFSWWQPWFCDHKNLYNPPNEARNPTTQASEQLFPLFDLSGSWAYIIWKVVGRYSFYFINKSELGGIRNWGFG